MNKQLLKINLTITACLWGVTLQAQVKLNDISLWGKQNSPGLLVIKEYKEQKASDIYIANYKKLFEEKNSIQKELTDNYKPWSSSYWPDAYGGIALRWQTLKDRPYPVGFEYTAIPLRLLNQMPENVRAELSKPYYRTHEIDDEWMEQLPKKVKSEIEQIYENSGPYQFDHYKRFLKFKGPSKKQLRNMSQKEIDLLSPAEKFDIYTGSYRYPLTKKVLRQATSDGKKVKYWTGICNGWTNAAMAVYEPKAKRLINSDGIVVNFASSDFKGLLSYYYSQVKKQKRFAKKHDGKQVGLRCKQTIAEDEWMRNDETGKEYIVKSSGNNQDQKILVKPECRDVNPGSFHIILANQIGRLNRGFAAEVVRDSEVWNQPVFGYDSSYEVLDKMKSYRTQGAVKQLKVTTKMYYADDGGMEYWTNPTEGEEFYAWLKHTTGTENYKQDHREYQYYLDINQFDEIIGGHWISYERPDFVWIKKNPVMFGNARGTLKTLEPLVKLVKQRKL
ncbi:hypothetical protein N9N67_05200 [Bacteriovoracaceae bacterium]|nr:hypothetical protein [Bacteriovoracaceae bacterium]